MTWRKRAEAAEKRIVVFQRFTSTIQALKDDGIDELPARDKSIKSGSRPDNSSASCSMHTENQDVFTNRIKQSFLGKTMVGGGDGADFEDDIEAMSDVDAVREYQLLGVDRVIRYSYGRQHKK
jgi:hypothetical protein